MSRAYSSKPSTCIPSMQPMQPPQRRWGLLNTKDRENIGGLLSLLQGFGSGTMSKGMLKHAHRSDFSSLGLAAPLPTLRNGNAPSSGRDRRETLQDQGKSLVPRGCMCCCAVQRRDFGTEAG